MNKQQAQQLIKDTFETTFDKGRFQGFIMNLLKRIDDKSSFSPRQGQYIPEKFRDFVSKYERIGNYFDSENRIDILIVFLSRKTSIERARSSQRNFIAEYLQGKFGSTNEKDAALVAYVSPDQTDWRFSLVKMDYKFEKTATGKMKVKEEFTPARRWSFLVGVNEKSHTAQSRLVKILADDEHAPTLAELEEAFNIEPVSNEFFRKYRDLFIRTKEALDTVVENDPRIKADFEAKGVDTVNFAKKLLGQIVFLYFLQKKGWFGVGRDDNWGTGSKQFLRKLFSGAHGGYQNFFNDILEPLFYEALRIGEERKQDDYYYSRFNCKIPFLNGGLFDPIGNYDWVHTDINLPNDLFSNTRKTKEGDTGDGILDVFDRYNFTVREDEPLEKEVAIDPELLGKAYEKFNAIRPDNFEDYREALKTGKKGAENKFNKKFGVYYTPREIVHYMCQQSLINYLHTELNKGPISYQKIGEAQTSAFGNEAKRGQLDLTVENRSASPISKEDIETLIKFGEQVSEHEAAVQAKGQETRAYSYKLPGSIRLHAKRIDKALASITVCDPAAGSGAFPVGMMNEIVRARNVLSVFLNNQERSDYEFKRRCIEHSLYGVDIDPGAVEIAKLRLWLSLVVDEEDIKNIKPLPNLDYKIVCGNSLLGVEKNLFNNQLFAELERLKPLYFDETNPTKKKEYKKKIDDLISQITNGHKEFDFEVYFSEVFHNKGGFDVVIANPPYKVVKDKEENSRYNKIYHHQDYQRDLYLLFFERASHFVKRKGVLSYITPNTWLYSLTYKKIRIHLRSHYQWRLVVLPKSGVFEAVVDNSVVVFKRDTEPASIPVQIEIWTKSGKTSFLLAPKYIADDGSPINVSIPAPFHELYAKIQKTSVPLSSHFDVFNGVKPFEKGKGKPPQDARIMREKPYVSNGPRPSGKDWRPLLRGRLIGRYRIYWENNYWIKYGPWLAAPRDPAIFDAPKKICVPRREIALLQHLWITGLLKEITCTLLFQRHQKPRI